MGGLWTFLAAFERVGLEVGGCVFVEWVAGWVAKRHQSYSLRDRSIRLGLVSLRSVKCVGWREDPDGRYVWRTSEGPRQACVGFEER